MRPRLAVASLSIALLLCAACGGPPSSNDPRFEWTVALSNLDDALLATCSDDDQLYVVGGRNDQGMVMSWTGTGWTAEQLPAGAEELWWCWIDPAGTVWAVGENATVVHNQGGAWTHSDTGDAVLSSTTLYGVWGTSDEDIYVVGGSFGPGGGPAIAHYNGSGWTAADVAGLPEEILFKVWGTGTEIWAVGTGGTVVQSSAGGAWVVQPTPVQDRLIAVWGAGDDVFAVGGDGRGVVLRYTSGQWTEFALTPEALSGVWTAPGQPLYIGGNRGYLGRYRRDSQGAVDSTALDVNVPVNDLCVHSLTNFGGAILAAGADLFSGNNESWRGGLLAHNGNFTGAIDDTDGGISDAGQPDGPLIDAMRPDAAITDAAVLDAGVDASLPGPGETCGPPPQFCAPSLVCWQLFTTSDLICTQDCTTDTECEADYGVGACCARPGPQTIDTVCIPAGSSECTMEW